MGRSKKKFNKMSESNANSSAGEAQEKQQQQKTSTDGAEESAVLPALAVEVPREEWPSLPQFKEIEENVILCKDAESKESKSIQCDCKHSSKELKRGKGCGEECLNRLLMMECRGGCPSGKYCTNKRFQKREYAEIELFYTGAKGWGMRAKQDITQGQFIIEYVGEVIGSREMQRRIRRYGHDPNHKHHYLMALRSGTVIDATTHGNNARFINHSCDPNAATQKWTVGRQLRIGFFALRVIKSGEEVVFNYQFERYGKRAQKCLCGSANCTGYIGATGREDSGVDSAGEEGEGDAATVAETDLSSSESELGEALEGIDLAASVLQPAKVQPMKRKKGRPPKHLAKFDRKTDKQHPKRAVALRPERISDPTLRETAEVSEILAKGPLRNREKVLEFNRLMVRVDQTESRRRMVDFLLAIEDPNILRLFVAHQGLALIRIWFVLPPFDLPALQLQSQIARLLLRLPVTNKNQVDEVCIMSTLNQMINMELPDKLVISEMVNQMTDFVAEEVDGPTAIAKAEPDPAVCEFEELRLLAEQLTDKWANLVNSDFRIPKKLSKTVSKLVTRGMAVLQNNKQNKRFVPRYKMSNDGFTNPSNDEFNEFGPNGEEPMNENDRDWQYRRFRNHFERRIRRRGGQPFFYHQQNANFNGGRENMMHLGGQLYNDPEFEPPPCFFNAPPRLPKLFPDALPYAAAPNSPSVLPHPNMAHPMTSHFYPTPSTMHPYCLPPMPSPYHHHHLYYAQNGVSALMPIPVSAPQPLPPPPPPPPPPERWIPEDEQLEMELDNGSDMDEDSSNGINTQHCPATASSCSNINKFGIKKEEPSAAVESDAIEKGGEKGNAKVTGTPAKDTTKKEKQQKREKQKSAKDLIKESLQRRIQSLKAQLGTKATPPIWGPTEPTDHRTALSGVKAERRWSRSRSPSPGSAGSRSRPSSTTPDSQSALKNRSSRSSPYKEQKKDEERRGHREDKAEQHDEERDKQQQHRRRRGERERRRSGPGEGGRDRSHGHKENRMSLSPDRTGGTDPYIDRRGGGRRRSSPGRRVGRFAGRSRIAMNNKRFFERRNRGRWPRKINCDSTNTIPRRRGGTYDRIRAQLAEQAYKHQMQDKKEETKLSPEEELQKQQDLNSKKAVINAYAEKLKGLIQTDKDSTAKLNNALTEMNIASKNRNYRQISLRQRSASTSSTSSTSSTVSSTSTTSSDSSSTTSSSSSSSSTSTDSQEKNDNTQRTTGRSSPKGVEPPKQPIMLKRMIGANRTVKNGQHVPTVQVENRVPQKVTKILPLESAQAKKGRFVAAFKIAPTAAHLPIANYGTKSAAVAKAFVNSDGGEDGEEETLPKNAHNKMEENPNQKLQKQLTDDKIEEHSFPTTMAHPSKVEEMKMPSEDCEKRAKQTETKEEPKEEERMVKREKKKKRKEQAEPNHEKEEQKERDEEDEDDNLQPPRFSLEILSDPGRMDAYIHQLKEFVYNVETLRRDMHGPPPLPSSMAAALRHHTNVLSPIPSSTSSSLLSSIGTSQQQNQQLSAISIKELKPPIGNSITAKTEEGKGEKQQPKQTVRQENTKRSKGTETAAPTRTTAKRERIEDEDIPSPSTSKVQSVLAKRLRVGSAERKDGQRQHAYEMRKHIDELQGVHSSVSVQASTPPEDPRTNNTDTPNVPPSSSVSVQQQQQPQSHLSLSSTVTTVVLSEPLLSSSTVGRRSTTVMTTVVDPSLGSTSHQQHSPSTAETKQHAPTAGDNKKGAGGAKANPFRNHPSLLNSITTDSDAHHLMENCNTVTNESCADVAETEPNDEVFAILNETTSTTAENELGEGLSANNGASSVVTLGEEAASASTTNASTFATAPLMSKSGIWLGARDTDGALYFYHRDTREARWDLPEGEELLIIDKSNVGGGAVATSPNAELMGIERQVRRAEFKRHVSALVAKCIDPYRRRFFHANGEYANFLRKITHKVLDNQPKSGNVELLFNEQVQKNTQRLVDEYIRHFKNRESHQLLQHRTDSQGLSPK